MSGKIWTGTLILCFLCFLGILLPLAFLCTDASYKKPVLSSSAALWRPAEPPKKIVFYTRFFRRFWDQGNYTDLALHGCPEARCVFSFNKSEAEDADAVLFHSEDFDPKDVPRRRHPRQRYIWRSQEGPFRQWNGCGGGHFFNWTYTYHRASDLFFPYGALVPLQGHSTYVRPPLLNKTDETYAMYLHDLTSNPFPEDSPPNSSSFFNRPKLVAWIVSRCATWSAREKYVDELQKHIQVDVYGKCGSLKCAHYEVNGPNERCYRESIVPNYLFYLSFENQLCVDYVTEKMWHPLMYGVVPVVYGGANYADFLPPHSYIDANQHTPKELAGLLTRIGSSPREYAKYHLWRRYWKVVTEWSHCELCNKLHHDQTPSSLLDTKRWWRDVSNCKKPNGKF